MLVDTASLAAKCPRMEAKGGIHPDKKPDLYKTELCHNWAEMGHCRYGKKCRFAHGAHELRSIRRHARYKTEICRTYHSTGACLYGVRCTFIHEDSDLPRMVDKDSESEDSDTSSSHSSVSGDGDSTITVLTVPLDPTTGRPNDKSFLVDNGTDSLDKLSDAFATHCSLQQQQQQCTSFNPLVGYGFNNVNNKAGATPLPPLPSLPFRTGRRERRLAAFASICSSIELENNPWNTNDSGSRRQQFLSTTTSAANVWSHHPNQRVFLQTK